MPWKCLNSLKNQLKDCDLSLAAQRTSGKYANGRLTLKIFGKPFSLDNLGRFQSDLHINPWIVMPVLGYVLHCQGRELTGKWIPFRELKNGRERNGLFVQRSEKTLKKIADTYPDLFEDLILIKIQIKIGNKIKTVFIYQWVSKHLCHTRFLKRKSPGEAVFPKVLKPQVYNPY
ncbi:MAG: hypothetical protein B6230_01435 [Desulfobacteraceae bacterium 4572_89]|nr:MAG: hypothetical protein B6230_01435 [Desulfobacteraceae bacterium 4572_89]